MKKFTAAAAAIITAIALTACSGEVPSASVKNTDSSAEASTCGMNITFPEDWEVLTGDDIYEKIMEENDTGYTDAQELKEYFESSGNSYIIYAENSDKTAQINITALKITADETTGEQLSLQEYAQTNHNDTLLGWQIDGYTLDNTGFGESSVGGKSGYTSMCDVYSDDTFLLGQSEFTFEYGGCFCSLQLYYHTAEAAERANEIIAGITAQ